MKESDRKTNVKQERTDLLSPDRKGDVCQNLLIGFPLPLELRGLKINTLCKRVNTLLQRVLIDR